MLGRHIYRVHPTEGRWTVTKEGEGQPRGGLANADQPSKVTIDNGDGIILEEHLLGRDLSQEMEN
jgi:hypothetical protein